MGRPCLKAGLLLYQCPIRQLHEQPEQGRGQKQMHEVRIACSQRLVVPLFEFVFFDSLLMAEIVEVVFSPLAFGALASHQLRLSSGYPFGSSTGTLPSQTELRCECFAVLSGRAGPFRSDP